MNWILKFYLNIIFKKLFLKTSQKKLRLCLENVFENCSKQRFSQYSTRANVGT